MVVIILMILMILGLLGFVIYSFVKGERQGWAIFALLLFGPMLAFGLLASINNYKYGDYKELVTDYGMEFHYKELGGTGTYTKNNLEFEYHGTNSDFETKFYIRDHDELSYSLHTVILNCFFNLSEDLVPKIYENLSDVSQKSSNVASMIIIGNHYNLTITYDYQNKKMEYTIIRIEESIEETVYDEDNNSHKETKYNKEYSTRYVKPQLYITHYEDNYEEIDDKIVNDFFNLSIDKFNMTNNGNKIIYTKK